MSHDVANNGFEQFDVLIERGLGDDHGVTEVSVLCVAHLDVFFLFPALCVAAGSF